MLNQSNERFDVRVRIVRFAGSKRYRDVSKSKLASIDALVFDPFLSPRTDPTSVESCSFFSWMINIHLYDPVENELPAQRTPVSFRSTDIVTVPLDFFFSYSSFFFLSFFNISSSINPCIQSLNNDCKRLPLKISNVFVRFFSLVALSSRMHLASLMKLLVSFFQHSRCNW